MANKTPIRMALERTGIDYREVKNGFYVEDSILDTPNLKEILEVGAQVNKRFNSLYVPA